EGSAVLGRRLLDAVMLVLAARIDVYRRGGPDLLALPIKLARWSGVERGCRGGDSSCCDGRIFLCAGRAGGYVVLDDNLQLQCIRSFCQKAYWRSSGSPLQSNAACFSP